MSNYFEIKKKLDENKNYTLKCHNLIFNSNQREKNINGFANYLKNNLNKNDSNENYDFKVPVNYNNKYNDMSGVKIIGRVDYNQSRGNLNFNCESNISYSVTIL